MAVPTISALSPNAGLSSGRNIVEITGTGFRLPPDPPATGPLGGEEQITVSVQFQGIASTKCASASDTLIICRVPAWTGAYDILPAALDVRVANLDDSGVEIAGENVTLAGAYTISRPSLVTLSLLKRYVHEVLAYFRRYILKNTTITRSRDFVTDVAANERAHGEAPVIYLAGPRLPHNGVLDPMLREPEPHPTDPNGWVKKEVSIVADLEFNVFIVTAGDHGLTQALGLTEALFTALRDAPTITVQGSDEERTHQIMMPFEGFPTNPTSPNLYGLHVIQATCIIKGVHLRRDTAIVIERGWNIYGNSGWPTLELQSD